VKLCVCVLSKAWVFSETFIPSHQVQAISVQLVCSTLTGSVPTRHPVQHSEIIYSETHRDLARERFVAWVFDISDSES